MFGALKYLKLFVIILAISPAVVLVTHFICLTLSKVGEISPDTALPSLVALLGLGGGAVSFYYNKTRDIKESHRNQKIETYRDFLSFLIEAMIKNNSQHLKKTEVDIKQQAKVHADLINWVDAEVIKSWNLIVDFSLIGDKKKEWEEVARFIEIIRKDLGHSDKKGMDFVRFLLKRDGPEYNLLFGNVHVPSR